jgi:hypothetical protein
VKKEKQEKVETGRSELWGKSFLFSFLLELEGVKILFQEIAGLTLRKIKINHQI